MEKLILDQVLTKTFGDFTVDAMSASSDYGKFFLGIDPRDRDLNNHVASLIRKAVNDTCRAFVSLNFNEVPRAHYGPTVLRGYRVFCFINPFSYENGGKSISAYNVVSGSSGAIKAAAQKEIEILKDSFSQLNGPDADIRTAAYDSLIEIFTDLQINNGSANLEKLAEKLTNLILAECMELDPSVENRIDTENETGVASGVFILHLKDTISIFLASLGEVLPQWCVDGRTIKQIISDENG